MDNETQKAPRILITGPVRTLDDWAEAARRAGFHSIQKPLLRIVERELCVESLPEDAALLALTSANALEPLVRLSDKCTFLKRVPLRCVGTRTRERARTLGFAVEGEAAEDGASLAAQIRREGCEGPVYWPRGSRSREFATTLERAGWTVSDAVAYESLDAVPTEPLPDAQAVFFASPSAVRVYLSAPRDRALEDTVAVAIGSTTAEALRDQPFLALASLPHPAPDALTWRLDHLGFDLPA